MALNLPGGKLAVPAAPEPPKKADKKTAPAPLSGNLATIIGAIRKEKGEKVIVHGNAIDAPRRLPTGIFEFDYYIGGGFPCGRLSIVYGPESSCKTNIALRAAAQAQKLSAPCNKVVWVDIEQCFDSVWAEAMGVDTSKLMVVKPAYGEEAADIIDAVVRADDVALVIVDSIAGLIANKEVQQSTENYDIGTSALLIKRLCNKMMVAIGEERKKNHEPCIVFINQTRFRPGVMFGDPETMPGGETQKFLSSLRVRVYAKNDVDKAANAIVFKDVHATIKKAKVLVRAAVFDFSLCVLPHDDLKIGDTASFNMVKSYLQELGLLTKTPQGYKVSFSKPETFQTIGAISDRYYGDHVFQQKLQKLVLDNSTKMVLVDEKSGPAEVEPGDVVQSVADADKI